MTVGGRYRYRLRIGDVGALRVSVVKAPLLSMVLLLTARPSSSAIGKTAHAARASVGRSGWFALPPVLTSAQRPIPDVATTPISPTVDMSVEEQVQRLRDMPDEAVVEDLTRTFGSELPPVWRPAADAPRRWLDSYASAMVDAWTVVSPSWRRAEPLLDLEVRRVGAAVVRGYTDMLLNALHPRMHYENGEIWVPARREETVELDGRPLVLLPTVAGPECPRVGFDLPDVAYLAYPVPGQADPGEQGATPMDPGGDPLCRVLGRVRAHVLQAASRPITMGQLAALVGCSPRMISYHCGELEAASLIIRERQGQSVWVSRTTRGHELADLLSA